MASNTATASRCGRREERAIVIVGQSVVGETISLIPLLPQCRNAQALCRVRRWRYRVRPNHDIRHRASGMATLRRRSAQAGCTRLITARPAVMSNPNQGDAAGAAHASYNQARLLPCLPFWIPQCALLCPLVCWVWSPCYLPAPLPPPPLPPPRLLRPGRRLRKLPGATATWTTPSPRRATAANRCCCTGARCGARPATSSRPRCSRIRPSSR